MSYTVSANNSKRHRILFAMGANKPRSTFGKSLLVVSLLIKSGVAGAGLAIALAGLVNIAFLITAKEFLESLTWLENIDKIGTVGAVVGLATQIIVAMRA